MLLFTFCKSVLALQRFVFILFIDEREHSLTTVLAEATLSNEIKKVLLNQPIFWQQMVRRKFS